MDEKNNEEVVTSEIVVNEKKISELVHLVRDQRVMLDSDLAKLV